MTDGDYHPYMADLDIIRFCDERGWPVHTHKFFSDMEKCWPFVVCELENATVLGDVFAPVCEDSILSDCLSFASSKFLAMLAKKEGSGDRRVFEVDQAFLLGGDLSFGTVISTVLMRVLYLKLFDFLGDVPVIAKAGMSSTLYEMFHAFGIPRERLILLDEDDALFCKKLYAPTIAGGVSPESNQWWIPPKLTRIYRDVILATYPVEKTPNPTGRVYIARRNTSKKLVKNEDEVMRFMERQGYEIVDPADMSLREQVELAQKTRYFVSCEGSQVHLADYAQPGSLVIMLCAHDFLQQRSAHSMERWQDLGVELMPFLNETNEENFLIVKMPSLEKAMRKVDFPLTPP